MSHIKFLREIEKSYLVMSDKELNDSLLQIEKILSEIMLCEENYYEFIDTEIIDKICQSIGQKIFLQQNIEEKKICDNNINLYITGALYIGGGHTREIEDLIQSIYNEKKNIVIVAGSPHRSDRSVIDRLKSLGAEVILNYKNSHKDRISIIKWLQYQISILRPNAVFVFPLPNDISIISAIHPKLVNKLYWNLNLDFGISPGLHIKSITKIIVKRPYLYFYLKDKLKFDNLTYIPFSRCNRLVSIDCLASTSYPEESITTASCTSSSNKIELSYTYKFVEIVPNILKITGGKHFHIGAISDCALSELYKNMDSLKIDRNKFVLIKFVNSFAEFLVNNKVDILLQTFPLPGGLVTIEAMQAGKMIINHAHSYSYLFNPADFCYKEALCWFEEEELYDFFKNLSRECIFQHSEWSRNHYLKWNNIINFKSLMDVNNFIGLEVEDKKYFVDKKYCYALDYFDKSLAGIGLQSNNKFQKVGRSLLYRLKKSINKRISRLVYGYIAK